MQQRATKTKVIYLALLILLLSVMQSVSATAQTYATTLTSSGVIGYPIVLGFLGTGSATTDASYGSVADTAYVTDAIYTNAATLTSKCFNIVLAGFAGESWIEPKFPAALPSGSTAYFRVDLPYSSGGVSLDVLGLVGELTNLFTKDLVIVDAYGGATTTTAGNRISAAKVHKALVKDTAGNYYIAVTADSSFNAARIGLRFNTGLLGVSLGAALSMKVYYGVQFTTPSCSGRPAYTDLGAYSSGLTVSVLDSVVKNPVNAIDDNLSTASRLGGSSLLSVGVASTVDQTFYFYTESSATDHIRVLMSTPGTILDIGLANSIFIEAYKGETLVSSQALGSLLTLDLLGLFSSTSGIAVYMNPGGKFDKVKVSYSHLVGASLIGNGVNIYDVRYVPLKPVVSKDTVVLYQYTTPLITATTEVGNELRWYNPLATMIGTGASFPATDTIAVSAWYHARAAKVDCNNLSDTARFYLKVIALNYTNPVVGTRTIAYSGLVASLAGPGMSGAGFRYTLSGGSVLPAGLLLNSNGDITGTASVTDTLLFTAALRDTVHDLDAGIHTFLITIRDPLALPPQVLPDATEGVAYSTVLPPASGGTGIYTYTLSASTPLPAGLSFNPLTRVVSGSAAVGTYPIRIDAEDNEGRTTFQTYSLLVSAPLSLHLLSFSGQLLQDVVALDWKTTSDATILGMQLQRSNDGINWSTMQNFVPLHDVSGTSSYHYEDNVAQLTGKLLYRLKVTEQNGKQAYSQVLQFLKQAIAKAPVYLYPNPLPQGGTLHFGSGSSVVSVNVRVFNDAGRMIFSGSNMSELNTAALPAGNYVLHFIVVGEQDEQIMKLVIE